MTDYGTYKALPAQKRDELGFEKWRETRHIGTHGPGCYAWAGHYACAIEEIARLNARLSKDAERYRYLADSTECVWPVIVDGDNLNSGRRTLDRHIDAAMADKVAPT